MELYSSANLSVPVDFDPFGAVEILFTHPTTEAQREIIVACAISSEAAAAYNESVTLELKGTLDRDSLERAIDEIVVRHEALRTVFSPSGLSAFVLARGSTSLVFVDLNKLDSNDQNVSYKTLGQADMEEVFDLVLGPLFRVKLICLSPFLHHLRLTVHHSVCDGWSLGIIMFEISKLYTGFLRDEEVFLPTPSQFRDFAESVHLFSLSDQYPRVEDFWRLLYLNPVSALDLPLDFTRPRLKTFRCGRIDRILPKHLVQDLRLLSNSSNASFVTLLIAIYELFIYKLTGSRDVVIGLPAAGQPDLGMKNLVGHCVNLLAVRSWVDDGVSFLEYLAGRRSNLLDVFENQRYTFGTLVRKVNPPREPGRLPLLSVVFNVDMNLDEGVAFEGLEHRCFSNVRSFENFELFLNATGSGDCLTFEWSFNSDLFHRESVLKWSDEFVALIKRVTVDPNTIVSHLLSGNGPGLVGKIPPREWNGSFAAYPGDSSLSQLFEEVSGAMSERIALVCGDVEISYSDLKAQVVVFASSLVHFGVKSGDFVGICLERNVDLIVAHLAIVRVGACYVPIDSGYPSDRIRFIIEDSKLPFIICDSAASLIMPRCSSPFEVISVEDLKKASPEASLAPLDNPDLPAYIMYTSGSSGVPKGVLVQQRSVVRLVKNQPFLDRGSDTVLAQLSNVSFDAATFEIWGALLNGGKLVLLPQSKPSTREIASAIQTRAVNTVFLTTGLFNLLVDEEMQCLCGLKTLLTGGEVMSVPHALKAFRALGPRVLFNVYGPTENTTFTSYHRIDSEADIGTSVPIGLPVLNTSVYVLDDQRNPVAIGVRGELYTGGDGVAIGYLRRDELTAERFLPDPFLGKGFRMYRTGDLVRWSSSGRLEFLGRADSQVKIRGFRIELGEVEFVVSMIPGVRDRVVLVQSIGEVGKHLVCYIVPSGFDPRLQSKEVETFIEHVRDYLCRRLPAYMVPSFYVLLHELPLNSNGKVHRDGLPLPSVRTIQRVTEIEAPRDEIESRLLSIWEKIFCTKGLGVNQSFFEIGGHSILGIQMLSAVEKTFGRALGLKVLFRVPTISGLANELRRDPSMSSLFEVEEVSAIQVDGSRIPIFCIHGDEANFLLPKYLSKDQPFYGTTHQGEDGLPIKHSSVESIAAHYISEFKKLVPSGPYIICGYSFGGLIAFEMACCLRRQGQKVPLLIMLDSHAPEPFAQLVYRDRKFYEPLKKGFMRLLSGFVHGLGFRLPVGFRNFYIIDTYDRAAVAYKPRRYDGDVVVIKASESLGPPDMGWTNYIGGSLVLRSVEGEHYELIREPLISSVARVVDDVISSRV